MSNYALIRLKDAITRLEGVGDVNIFGQRDYSMRVWLDPYKLVSRNMTAGDVVRFASKSKTCRWLRGKSASSRQRPGH